MARSAGGRLGALLAALAALLWLQLAQSLPSCPAESDPDAALEAEAEESALLQIQLTVSEHHHAHVPVAGGQLHRLANATAADAGPPESARGAQQAAANASEAQAAKPATRAEGSPTLAFVTTSPATPAVPALAETASVLAATLGQGAQQSEAEVARATQTGVAKATAAQPLNATEIVDDVAEVAAAAVVQEAPPAIRSRGGWMMFTFGVLSSGIIFYIIQRLWSYTAKAVGLAIEFGVETFDRSIIGVDMEIGKLSVNLCEGNVVMHGFKMRNPDSYNSDHLLECKKVRVDIDMCRLLFSGFREIRVEALYFKRVDIIYEKSWKSSNIHDVLEFLRGPGTDTKAGGMAQSALSPRADPPESASLPGVEPAMGATGSMRRRKPKHEYKLTLEKVDLEDIAFRAQAQMLGGRGARVSVPDISYDHFTKEMGEHYIEFIIKNLLKTVLKSIAANVMGQSVANKCL